MSRVLLMALGALCLGAMSHPAWAMMRCGNQIISGGDPQAKVAASCGEPEYVTSSTIIRAGLPRQPLYLLNEWQRWRSQRELLVHDRSYVEIPVEVWVYNLGPNKLMREVVFEEGRVVRVESLGYGY